MVVWCTVMVVCGCCIWMSDGDVDLRDPPTMTVTGSDDISTCKFGSSDFALIWRWISDISAIVSWRSLLIFNVSDFTRHPLSSDSSSRSYLICALCCSVSNRSYGKSAEMKEKQTFKIAEMQRKIRIATNLFRISSSKWNCIRRRRQTDISTFSVRLLHHSRPFASLSDKLYANSRASIQSKTLSVSANLVLHGNRSISV